MNPYADQLTFLDDKTRTRRDHEKYLSLIDTITLLHQYQREIKQTTFNEFVVQFPKGFQASYESLLEKGIIAGLPLECYYPELSDHYLLCVTETMSKEDMDSLVKEIK